MGVNGSMMTMMTTTTMMMMTATKRTTMMMTMTTMMMTAASVTTMGRRIATMRIMLLEWRTVLPQPLLLSNWFRIFKWFKMRWMSMEARGIN